MKGAFNMLAVSANGTSMVTIVNTGIAFVEGRYYLNDSPLPLSHDTESLGNNRIDRIVIRMDLSTEARYVKTFIKKGTPSANPVPPVLTQTPNLYEISLAQVKVVGGQTFIQTNAVTDERGKDVICPWAGSNILPSFDDNALAEHIKTKATTTQEGHVQLNDTLISPSSTQAATANAIKQVNDKLIGTKVKIGSGASQNYPENDFMVSIGNNTSAGHRSVAIGDAAKTKGNVAVALGANTNAGGGGSIVIGGNAGTTAYESVALGYLSWAPNDNEGVFGGNTKRWNFIGSLSVSGTKNFEISHPHPDKKHTHVIRHGAVESPTTGDTLYRYKVEATTDGETVEVQLPDYFEYLNTDIDVWVNPDEHFGRASGKVIGGKLLVTCEKVGAYKALVIGTRNDDNVQDWHIKGVEREVGESWLGETYIFEVDEITEVTEFEEVLQ